MIKACIFDLDGTLANTLVSIAHSANRAITDVGLPANPVESYKKYVGDGSDEMLKRSLLAAGDHDLSHFEQAKVQYTKYFEVDYMYQVEPYDGIVELLTGLKKQGKKLAVLTNKQHERAIDVVEELFGKSMFDMILGQSDLVKKKPDPEGAIKIANEFGVLPKECMYVGDTDTDMKTGNSAGMYTVGVTWGFRDREELEANHAHFIVDSPIVLLEPKE